MRFQAPNGMAYVRSMGTGFYEGQIIETDDPVLIEDYARAMFTVLPDETGAVPVIEVPADEVPTILSVETLKRTPGVKSVKAK